MGTSLTQNRILVLDKSANLQADFDRALSIVHSPSTNVNHFKQQSYGELLGRKSTDTKLRKGKFIDISDPSKSLSSINLSKHPKPAANFGVSSKSSYLNRHSAQLLEFRKHILPLLINKRLESGERNLNIAVIGPGFDEHASIMGAIAQEFTEHKEWGDIQDWDLHIDLFDNNLPVLMEALERINGRSPLSSYKFASDKHKDEATVSALNQSPQWFAQRATGFYANVEDPNVIRFLKSMGYDALFMNATFLSLDSLKAKRLAKLFSTIDAFFIGDRVSDAPIHHLPNTHIIYNRINADHHETDYAVAVPKKFSQEWQSNTTGRPEEISTEELGTKPRLRILLITDDSDSNVESWLREHLGCWSKHHNLNNAEITVINSKLPVNIQAKIMNKCFDTVFIDTNKLNLSNDRIGGFANYEIKKYNSDQAVVIISDDEIKLEDYQKDNVTILPKASIINERVITDYIKPIAEKNGILFDNDADKKFQLSAKLASLQLFVESSYLHRIDLELVGSNGEQEFNEIILGLPERQVTPQTQDHTKIITELNKIKLKEGAPKELRIALRNFRSTLIQVLPEILTTVDDFTLKFGFESWVEELDRLVRTKNEFDICLEADQSDLETYMDIHWGGCGDYKLRRIALKENLLPNIEEGLKVLEQWFIEKPGTDLSKAFNGLVGASKNLRLKIKEQIKALIERLEGGQITPLKK